MFAASPDGIQIAYDRNGAGPAVILLHGGGGNRQEWHTAGYVERLREYFTVIAVDLRGHGESSAPTNPAAYTTGKMTGDILAVADACGVERFIVLGFSFGSNVGRYLAVQSGRIDKIVLLGNKMGPGVSGKLRQDIYDFWDHWSPIVAAQRAGALELASLSEADQELWGNLNVPVVMAWGKAMLDWPSIVPSDLPCPTLWLVGSEDSDAMASVREYEESLASSQVQVNIVEGLNHEQTFDEIEQVFPTMLAFTQM